MRKLIESLRSICILVYIILTISDGSNKIFTKKYILKIINLTIIKYDKKNIIKKFEYFLKQFL